MKYNTCSFLLLGTLWILLVSIEFGDIFACCRTMLGLCDDVHDLICKICNQSNVKDPDFTEQCLDWGRKVQ